MNNRKYYLYTHSFWNLFLLGLSLFCFMDFLSFMKEKIILSEKDIKYICQNFIFCSFLTAFSFCFLVFSLFNIPKKEKDSLSENDLIKMLEESIENEDFEQAAKIRDLLKSKK